MKKIETIEEFNELLQENHKFLFVKHSTTCPVSQAAFDEFETFIQGHTDVAAYYLFVQEARPLSNYIAEEFEIKHESPQALLFENQSVKWNASHWKITKSSLNNAVLA
ncbi:bacillithiol system redox-active protein YtxJ [Litchfieldia alkalitelluris]|uniref:bacillithiol system redox-active protein YtxJ n=1 Tax=Litchfieldia alkalitelluris TaxID=304268 RepID=UPI0009969A96|nr:bacillithiol system redox-active protein YtxJ [Litchfieldia alkalitelluris]